MRMFMRTSPSLMITLTLFVAAPSSAVHAQGAPSDEAQRLFDEATEELDRGQYALACPKLEAVTRMVPSGVGAKETLAECYEKQGRLVSAWRQYSAAEAAARAQNKLDRARGAAAHAASLKPRLSAVSLEVSSSTPGLKLELDGVSLGSGPWSEAIPLDGGTHTVTATAPGYKAYSTTFEAPKERASIRIRVPALAAENRSPERTSPVGQITAAERSQDDHGPASPNGRVIGGVVSAGVGALGVASGIASSLLVMEAQKALDGPRDSVPWGSDVCDPTVSATLPGSSQGIVRDACGKAIFVPLQFLFYGLGAVAGGAGVYLLMTARPTSSSTGAAMLVPTAGPSFGLLNVVGAW